MVNEPIAIIAAKRTPIGSFQGVLSSLTAPQLGSAAVSAALQASTIAPDQIEDLYMGCVLSAGLGQAPARQAALGANLSPATHCATINKVCGSGMQAIMMACNQLRLGESTVAIAGGMESMTNAPYLLTQARSGYRLGHGQVFDHMMMDGLEDAYHPKGQAMGVFAENTAERYGFSRADQDAFAIASGERAIRAWEQKYFTEEVTPLSVRRGKETITVERDEPLSRIDASKVPLLKPVFREGGTVTAANSSPITDGAAAVVLMRAKDAERQNLNPLALIHGYTTHSLEPQWFTLAPAGAIQKLSEKLNWPLSSVDLFEINEAFAVVTMAAMKDLNLPHDKVNIHGGACALGHPIGASGARLVVTLVHALRQHKLKRGIASLCIGGGEATALGIEVVG